MGIFTINSEEIKLVENKINLNKNNTSEKACTNYLVPNHVDTDYYWLNSGEIWATSTKLWVDSSLTTLAPHFWYSDGVTSREWDGVNFIGNNVNC